MADRFYVVLAAIWIACLVPGRVSAEDGRLHQIEQRVQDLEQRSQQDAGTQHEPWVFTLPAVQLLAIAAFCALWARGTGRDPWLWLAAGLVFNIFALLAVWSKHEDDKKTAKATQAISPLERLITGGTSSTNIRPS
jgi:hypothetical protein